MAKQQQDALRILIIGHAERTTKDDLDRFSKTLVKEVGPERVFTKTVAMQRATELLDEFKQRWDIVQFVTAIPFRREDGCRVPIQHIAAAMKIAVQCAQTCHILYTFPNSIDHATAITDCATVGMSPGTLTETALMSFTITYLRHALAGTKLPDVLSGPYRCFTRAAC